MGSVFLGGGGGYKGDNASYASVHVLNCECIR